MSLPPREAWIEIYLTILYLRIKLGRFPRGKRGLKLNRSNGYEKEIVSLPSREAWIEIYGSILVVSTLPVASLAGSVD